MIPQRSPAPNLIPTHLVLQPLDILPRSRIALPGFCQLASGSPLGNQKAWISTNDTLVAFLWTCIMKARFPSGPTAGWETTSHVSIAINRSKGLTVPPEYAGNIVFCGMTGLSISDLIARESGDDDRPLAAVAQSTHKNMETDKNFESKPHSWRSNADTCGSRQRTAFRGSTSAEPRPNKYTPTEWAGKRVWTGRVVRHVYSM